MLLLLEIFMCIIWYSLNSLQCHCVCVESGGGGGRGFILLNVARQISFSSIMCTLKVGDYMHDTQPLPWFFFSLSLLLLLLHFLYTIDHNCVSISQSKSRHCCNFFFSSILLLYKR